VNGTVLITHGRAKRRMIGFAVEVGAAAARAGIPARIAEAVMHDRGDDLPDADPAAEAVAASEAARS
jgi:hypothetical protein